MCKNISCIILSRVQDDSLLMIIVVSGISILIVLYWVTCDKNFVLKWYIVYKKWANYYL